MLMGDRLAVLGSPIAHSKSPALHLRAYRELGRAWSYDRLEMREDKLAAFLAGADDSWRGLSLTMPLKNAAFAASEIIDDDARLTGAVNTLRLDDGPLTGFNTDIDGIVRAVRAAGPESLESALVLGGGATAASAVAAAARLGAQHIDVAVRTPERAAHLMPLAETVNVDLEIRRFRTDPVDSRPDLVFSTLPGGTPAPEQYHPDMRAHALLFDAAYAPWPSALARAWHADGGRVVSGLAMLVHQALLQVRIFDSGSPRIPLADEERVLTAMRAAVDLPADGLA